ncbi:MAG: SMP-30/gluconolactonase/LRE family protein [Caulobacterales bacterium]|nr:SMP-30/gluconolactonase/LRE family protein [Caulobacterales bacterium]
MRVVVEAADVLGEGPVWAASEGRLYWFDIKRRRLHWHAPQSGEAGEVVLSMRASAAAPRTAGGLFLATDIGLAVFDPGTQAVEVVRRMALPAGFRTNDGGIDPQGRFWWSTMDDNGGVRPGAVFVTEADGRTEKVLDDVHIANTLTVSADGATLYLADSGRQTLWACDTADLSRRRVLATTDGDVAPDGSALDAEGFLWNAQWGAARLVRYAPDGRVDRIVEVPVDQPTSCAFGGSDLATLFVTSARDGLSETALGRQPLAGALFAFEPGVTGLPLATFAG